MLAATVLASILLAPQQAAPPPSAPPAASPPAKPAPETKEQKAERQHKEDLKADTELGAKYAAEAEKEYKLSTNQDYIQRVQRIGKVLADIANKTPVTALWGDKRLNPFPYEYKVIQGKDVNAFSIPGGHVYVFEGLLKEVESDDELAGVLAHETAHAEMRHVATLQHEQSKLQNISLPLVLIAILTGGAGAAAGALGVSGLVSQATGSGWSVKAEEAADYGGFQYLLKSPYDPTGMLTFMERLARKNMLTDNIDWGIYKSHPPSRERAETLIGYMNAAHVPIRRSKVASSYRTTVMDEPSGGVSLRFGGKTLVTFSGADAKARANVAVAQVNAFFDSSPELFELQAGPDGTIVGSHKVLFRILPTDATQTSLADVQAQTLKAMQIALYATGDRVWGQG